MVREFHNLLTTLAPIFGQGAVVHMCKVDHRQVTGVIVISFVPAYRSTARLR